MTRTAISPRLAMRTLLNTCPSGCSGDRTPYPTAVPAPARTSELGRWRVEHFAELDSTNRYAARRGPRRAPRTASWPWPTTRPRAGAASTARWEAPPGVVAAGLGAAAAGPGDAGASGGDGGRGGAGRRRGRGRGGSPPSSKWPNDLVVGDRKLAGLLAERDGDALVVGAGCNVNWDVVPARAGRDRDRVQPRGRARASTATRCSTAFLDGLERARRRSTRCVDELPGAARPRSGGACASSTCAATTSSAPRSTSPTTARSSCATTPATTTSSPPPTSSTSAAAPDAATRDRRGRGRGRRGR